VAYGELEDPYLFLLLQESKCFTAEFFLGLGKATKTRLFIANPVGLVNKKKNGNECLFETEII
jgi:hypothetical protein